MRASLSVGGIIAPSGQLAYGTLPVGVTSDGLTPIHIPAIVLNGAEDGPVVYLHAGSHGQETVYAVEMMRFLSRQVLIPGKLKGSVVMVPVANIAAHQAATRISPLYGVREGGAFGGDMHKLWPGEPEGSITQRLAHAIWASIVSQADYVLDYHTNSDPGIPFALMYAPQDCDGDAKVGEAWKRSLDLARAFGLTVVRGAHTPNSLAGASLQSGRPAMTIEVPSPRVMKPEVVAYTLAGTMNVLAELGMVEAEVTPLAGVTVLPGEHRILPSIRANQGGIVHYEVAPGTLVEAGQVIARVFDVLGSEVEMICMPQTGYVSTFPPFSWSGAQMVASGEYVADCFD